MKPRLVVFTGAGISAESGISTFRDAGGLWEKYTIEEVATPQAWKKNQQLVLEFYNSRRKQVLEAQPNKAHYALVELEEKYDVFVITQNIDDLHERAGSEKVLHLHGEITKSRSTLDPALIYKINGTDIKMGEKCERGSQLRPHIVWFGEMVPQMEEAQIICEKADLFMVVGSSMVVYPAAGLIDYIPSHIPKYLIDPADVKLNGITNLRIIKEKAGIGLTMLAKELMNNFLEE